MTIANEELRSMVDRIERLESEKKALGEDIKDLYTEAKGRGFCPKALKALIAERRKDPEDVQDLQNMLDVYRAALGQLDGTPLGQAAMARVA